MATQLASTPRICPGATLVYGLYSAWMNNPGYGRRASLFYTSFDASANCSRRALDLDSPARRALMK